MASPDAPKHASGDAQSQSLECDGQDHTFVWVAIAPADAPALAGSDIAEAEVTASRLERDDFSSNRPPALAYWRSMIFSENRHPPRIKSGAGFFGIML
jgi:hypothetical protein